MRRRHIIPVKWLLAYCLFIVCIADVGLAVDIPIRLDYLGNAPAKPPENIYVVRLTLKNNHDTPVWFVLPYWGDQPLPEKGIFLNDINGQPFEGKQFDGEGGHAIEVVMLSGGGFKAFRLPAKAQLELDGYSITASSMKINEIVVFEAQELKVNGKTSLENWLPYRTTSDKKVKVTGKALGLDSKNLDWDEKTRLGRQDYPMEKVNYVQGDGLRKWTVKLQPKHEEHAP